MPEKKVLPVLSMVVSFVCLLDHIFFFATYSYLYLPLVASSLALISLVQNKGRQKVWSLAELVLAVLAVAVVAYAQRLFLIKCKVPPSYYKLSNTIKNSS
ncbi:hypothetical protein [Streptococcus pyogenes]|uniref:hypothetical protein n=1 Tax=Streptococcus pyogenes TaxID=1314 RepID=UPI000DA3352E|nr:hypothetical membrane spanning protein [Streptococcus pyogenes]VGW24498.1 Uncharacterised protein [Streptococcus pyogenes]VGW28297.1 Uncharacterised protein [Streptococcus pyogenes]VGW29019.1 Uncharacterised protein [Streptococcus pyogenes]VGW36238.1 Uncharacterised protein [Streptococcus pyogenes]